MKSDLSDRIRKAGTILSIPIDMIESASEKVRKNTDDIDLLTESIRVNGIIQPLSVRYINNRFQIISGERRFAAAKRLKLDAVPCIVMSVSDEKSVILSLTENQFSQKIDFYDEAFALSMLNKDYGMSAECISDLLCKTINNTEAMLSYNSFSPEIKENIEKYELTDYILSLSKLKTDSDRLKFIEYIISKQQKTEEIKEDKCNPVISFNKPNDYRVFINSIINTVDTMRKAGINAVVTQKRCSGCIECVIRIPEMTTSPVRLVGYSCDAV